MENTTVIKEKALESWLGGSLGWCVITRHQGCRRDFWSGHIHEPSHECIDEWANEPMFLFTSLVPQNQFKKF